MSKLDILQHDFTAGIRRSRSRDDLGTNAQANVLWNAKDWIIGRLGVPLGKRGGWTYQGSVFESTVTPTVPSYVAAMSNDPFNGGNFMRAIDINGKVWVAYGSEDFATWHKEMDYNSHSTEYNHPTGPPLQNGVFIGDGLFFPSCNGTAKGSTHNEIYGLDWESHGGTNNVVYLSTWLNRLVGLDAHEYLCFGDPNPSLQLWDPDAKYYLGQPGRGLAPIGRDLFIFFDGKTKKVTGDTPAGYGVITDNIAINPFSDEIGLIDAFSLTPWGTQIIWVDHSGVYASDGNSYPLDLAWAGGAQDLFREFISSYIDRATTRVACGIYSNQLYVSMTNVTTHAHIDTIVCDLNRRTWSRMTNMGFTCYVRGPLDSSETWAGVGTTIGRVAKISPVLTPSLTYQLDGDGTPVQPSFETAYFRFGPMASRIQRIFAGYEIDGTGTYEVQDIIHTGTSGHFTVNGQSINWDATAADAQTALNATLGAGIVTVTRPVAKHFVITWNAVGPQTALTVAQSTLNAVPTATTTTQGWDPPKLKVEFATDPKADPSFLSYSGAYYVDAKDIHGASDLGYHWKPIPVRAETPGVAIKVTQVNPSSKTSFHSIGVEGGPLPTYTQR